MTPPATTPALDLTKTRRWQWSHMGWLRRPIHPPWSGSVDKRPSADERRASIDSKRILDIAVGSYALALATPVLAGVAMAMRLSGDRGSFFYRAQRVGAGATTIRVLKIRTMVHGVGGAKLTTSRDPRVTHLGRLLRQYRIDELPQLVNVVRGEMSLVGPRPEDPFFVDLSNPLHRRVFSAKPGITGLAQLEFHDEANRLVGRGAELRYRDEILPAKLRLDAEYLDSRSTLLDVQIVLRTLRTVFCSPVSAARRSKHS
jgi:lipopolysaccharide/colanic/teichoic acid biosynthesis glycosyltransferase